MTNPLETPEAFAAWLEALEDDAYPCAGPGVGIWSCGCPLEVFLRANGYPLAVVTDEGWWSSAVPGAGELTPAQPWHTRFVRLVDRLGLPWSAQSAFTLRGYLKEAVDE